ELAQNSVEGRMLEVQKSTLDMAGSARLDQIRASMGGGQLAAAPETPAVTQGPQPMAEGAPNAGGQTAQPSSPEPAMREPAWRREFAATLAEAPKPRKKLARVRRRARRRAVFRALVALLFAWWTSAVGDRPGLEGSEIFFGGVTVLVGAGAV